MLQFTGSFYTTNKLKLDPMVKDISKILLSLKSYLRRKDRTTQFRVFGISYSQPYSMLEDSILSCESSSQKRMLCAQLRTENEVHTSSTL